MGAPQQVLIADAGVPKVYATWDPANKGAAITLTNGNLTTTQTVTAGLVRATVGKSAGKWYWEVLMGPSSADMQAGIANSTASLSQYCGQNTNSWGYYSADGKIYTNNVAGSANSTYANGDVIGFALDMGAGTLQFYKNNVLQTFTVSGLSGTIYPAWGDQGTIDIATANFGATALTYSPPSGFNAGLY